MSWSSQTFDDNQSVWLAGAAHDEPAPALTRDLQVDVAIIGGGFTGVSTAYELSRRLPQLGIALFEGKRLGNGASGRSGGMMLNGIAADSEDLQQVVREHQLTTGAMDDLQRLIDRHGLQVRMRREGSYKVSTTAQEAEYAHQRVEKLAALGLPLTFIPSGQLNGVLRARGAAGTVLDPTEGVLNGVDLIRGLRPVLQAQGVAIYEDTPITRIAEGKVVQLQTATAQVTAKAVVLATNGYTPRLGYFRTGILPVISHVIATKPLSAELLASAFGSASAFSDDQARIAYCSVDSERRVLFGGGSNHAYGYHYGNRTASSVTIDDPTGLALKASLGGYFPDLAGVEIGHRWCGPLGLTLARHCAMGVMGSHANMYYALGYSGHGVVLANLAGKVLADLYQGNHDPWRKYAFYNYRPGGIPPEPLRWVGYHAFTKATGRSPWKNAEKSAPASSPTVPAGE